MSNLSCFQLFVYGSLRKGFNSPAYEYMSRYFNFVASGKVEGELYDLGEYPAAIPTDKPSFIIGELYEIKQEQEFEWAMAQLDDYEGVDAPYDETAFYQRLITDIFLEDGTTVKAWVYWFTGSVEGKPLIHSGDMLAYNASRHQS